MSNAFNCELAVVGSCMTDINSYWAIADVLSAEDFGDGRLHKLFEAIAERAPLGSACDAVTLADEFPALSDFILGDCLQEGWRSSNVRGYAERVVSNGMARRIRSAGQQIARLDGDDILGQAQRILAACAPQASSGVKHIRHFVKASSEDLMRKYSQAEELTGLTSGIPELDELTCGWQPSDLIVLAARPSVGKTALALAFAQAAARSKNSNAVMVFSLEMSGKQLADRAISSAGRLDGSALRNPKRMGEEDWPRLTNGIALVSDLPIYICDEAGLTIEQICARARQQHAQTPLSLIVLDYLTMIKPPKANTTAEAIQIISRALKGLAKELNVAIIVLSQLNRDGEGQRPTMKTLRDSGAIEQDADVIMFLHRPNPEVRWFLELILEKQRNGPTGDLALQADMAHMRFSVASHIPEGVKSHAKTVMADAAWDDLEGSYA